MLGGAALIGAAGLSGEAALLGASLAAACLIYLSTVWLFSGDGGELALDTGVYGLAGLVLVPWMLNHAPLLLTLPQGAGLLIFLLLTVSTSDSWASSAQTLGVEAAHALSRLSVFPSIKISTWRL